MPTQNTSNILKFTSDIETMNDELEELNKQRNNVNNKNTGILLLNEPTNLNKETVLNYYDIMKDLYRK